MQWQSTGLWMINDRFIIEDELILPVGDVPKRLFYNPYEFRELPAYFANLKEGDDLILLDFYTKWGLLGYVNLFRRKNGASKEAKLKEVLERQGILGEHLEWAWAHVRTVKMLLHLIELWSGGNSEALEEHLHDLFQPMLTYAGGLDPYRSMGLGQAAQWPLHAAAVVITGVINQNIEEISTQYQVLDLEAGGIAPSHSIPALISIIYAHIGEAAATRGHGYYRCQYRWCKKWNPYPQEKRGPKPKYCQEPTAKESLCARRERYYRKPERNGRETKT